MLQSRSPPRARSARTEFTRRTRLIARLGTDVHACIEMMSGAVWVRDRLSECGWTIEIADARKVKAIAPLACKTDRVHARARRPRPPRPRPGRGC